MVRRKNSDPIYCLLCPSHTLHFSMGIHVPHEHLKTFQVSSTRALCGFWDGKQPLAQATSPAVAPSASPSITSLQNWCRNIYFQMQPAWRDRLRALVFRTAQPWFKQIFCCLLSSFPPYPGTSLKWALLGTYIAEL